ncbi:MAG: hypothetical protein IIB44_08770 [Candidatus Marinimicrobia bacterium]|nr:hypothetical protein [Candidatus Neomarinimicrobiota bacterium]
MDFILILLFVLVGVVGVLALFSYKNLLKFREELRTIQREIIDLRNHVNLSLNQLKNEKSNRNHSGEKHFTSEMSIGEILAKHPGAQNVLAMFHLGGCSSCSVTDGHILGEAIKEYGINKGALLGTLNGLFEGFDSVIA